MRRRYNKKRRNIIELILELIYSLPWPIGLFITAATYYLLKAYLPENNLVAVGQSDIKSVVGNAAIQLLQTLSPFIGIAMLMATIASAWNSRKKRKMLDEQMSLRTIAELSPRDFEFLVGEAYRRKGFEVIENEGEGADGGVDLLLKSKGKTYIVQCKHYKSKNVGVPIIREMYGLLMGSDYAETIVIVTSGQFSKEAKSFAQGKPIELVPGDDLLGIIKEVQKNSKIDLTRAPDHQEVKTRKNQAKAQGEKLCPQCSKGYLIKRTVRKGNNKGKSFTGCTEFPRCRYVKY